MFKTTHEFPSRVRARKTPVIMGLFRLCLVYGGSDVHGIVKYLDPGLPEICWHQAVRTILGFHRVVGLSGCWKGS